MKKTIFASAIVISSLFASCQKESITPKDQPKKYDIISYEYTNVTPYLSGYPKTTHSLTEVTVTEQEAKEICSRMSSTTTTYQGGYKIYIERGASYQLCTGPNGHPRGSMY